MTHTNTNNGNPLDVEYWNRIDRGLPSEDETDARVGRLHEWLRGRYGTGDEDEQ